MPSRYYCWLLSLLSSVATLYTPANAVAFQSLVSIQASAERHLHELLGQNNGALHITADALDSRLRLAACAAPLEVFLPSGANIGSRVTTGVRCTQGAAWTIYLPVTVESEAPALILNKALARNAAVTSQDIEVKVLRSPGLGTTNLKNATELAGKRLKRDLPSGTVLSAAMFQPEVLIRRGQQVTLVALISGIEVRTQAVALSDGSASARIRVKNLNSAKVVEGTVDSNNTVRVDL